LVLHIAAIVFYARVKKHNLVGPMLTGNKVVPKDQAVEISQVGIRRLVVALSISVFVAGGVESGVQYILPAKPASTVVQNW
jgi:hypothetical protein